MSEKTFSLIIALLFSVNSYSATADSLIIYSIQQGAHRSLPSSFLPLKLPQKLEWQIEFDENCAYDLGDEDQLDCNKLCGVAFYDSFLSAMFKMINQESPQHTESARIGWRWNDEKKEIELLGYYYCAGQRFIEPICSVGLKQRFSVVLEIDYENKIYNFTLKKRGKMKRYSHQQKFEHDNKNAYLLGFYFGGNKTAPHTMSAKIEFKN